MNDDEREFEAAARQITRLQRPGRTPRGMSKLVSQVIARRGIAQAASNEDVVQAWRLTCNGKWSDQTRVGPIRRGRLEIQVANSLVNQEMNFEKTKLLESMQQKMPHAKLKDISFRIGFFSRTPE